MSKLTDGNHIFDAAVPGVIELVPLISETICIFQYLSNEWSLDCAINKKVIPKSLQNTVCQSLLSDTLFKSS